MPTLAETLQALHAVQQIDSQIQRAKKAQAALDNGTEATNRAMSLRDTAAEKRQEQHRLAGNLKDSELKLETLEAKRKNYQSKLYQGMVTNAKELANIEKEIDALGRQRSDLDGRILELMELVEQAQEAATVAEAEAQGAEGHRGDVVSSYHSRLDALNLEITDLTRRRQEAAALVEDGALFKRYEEIRIRAGGVGIARIEGNSCSGCHMTLPSTLIKAVKEAAQVQTCDNCGRLLCP